MQLRARSTPCDHCCPYIQGGSGRRARRTAGPGERRAPAFITSGLRSRVGELALCGLQDAGAVLVRALVGPDVVGAIVVALGQDGDHLGGGQLVIRRTDPDAYAFPNTRGGRIARQRVARIVGEAATRASDRVSQRGLPPLPHTTPHTLRRTYISIALLANRFDVLWVMGQVGHADSKMTLDVYAQLQQRVKREHGRAFDTLVRQAREQLYGTTSGLPEAAPEPNLGHESGHDVALGESDGPRDERIGDQESSDLQADPEMARPGLEPGTPRSSAVRPCV